MRASAAQPASRGRLLVLVVVVAVIAAVAAVLLGAPHGMADGVVRDLSIPAIVGAGFLDGFNPCAFGVLILFATFTLGLATRESLAAGGGVADVRRASRTVLGLGLIFVTGVLLTYFALGLGALAVLTSLSEFGSNHLPTRIAALVAISMGIWMLRDVLLPGAAWQLAAPQALHGRIRLWARQSSPFALFGGGVLIGLCTVPCSGAVYLGVVALLGASGTFGAGLGGLVLYNLAYIAPLVVLLILASRPGLIRVVNRWHLDHAQGTRLVLAIVVLALGFAILLAV